MAHRRREPDTQRATRSRRHTGNAYARPGALLDEHPEVRFRSTSVDLADDGTATVRGELTIKGVTREVVASGTWSPLTEGPRGGEVAALELSAQLDRTQFGMTWNAPLPKGGNILDEQVTLTVHLELQAQA